ncbi:cell division protein ZapA [Azomonas agilis]|uniref:Cell division protein ZapA n=1 Tax=Azomonas agilis TaxID=116849 RepID=A0A562IKV8_9GAMM|nr:cell division protein ZapA [Azomonas agilis]TWH71466.1 cell division protein ZapA [Azomonas agilis]
MNQQNTVTIHIMDKMYHIVCPPDERANLENAARYLDSRMREIRSHGKVIGADRVAVMAALNITHELLYGGRATPTPEPPKKTSAREKEREMRQLLERADTALSDEGHTPNE